VPRQLDTLCDQILNGDPRTGDRRFESAASVSAALGQYLGDSLSGATVAVQMPTVFLEAPSATESGAGAAAGSASWTGAGAAAGSAAGTVGRPDVDPDATHPGGPLFDRDTDVRPSTGPRTGMGVGAAPPAWGPDSLHDSGTVPPVQAEDRPGTSWLRLAAIVATLGVVLLAVIVVLFLGRGKSPEEQAAHRPSKGTPAAGAPKALTPAAVRDFDPDQVGGTPEENPQEVPLATDGKPSTAWTTVRYNDGPVLAPYKDGVGLLIDLGADKQVRDVTVTLVGAPYDLSLLAAPRGASATPTSVQGLTTVDTRKGAAGQIRLAGAQPVTTRYLVVWLTALPPVPGGFRGGISEVSVRS
jgi:putative peptidoglycan lipid II flippase